MDAAPPLASVTGQLLAAADLLEALGENPHRVHAYRRGADTLETHAPDFSRRYRDGTLTDLPGIGREMAAKVEQIARDGQLATIDELNARVPAAADSLTAVPGVERKLAIYLAARLHVNSVAHLKQLAQTRMLRTIPWLGEDGERRVLAGLSEWTGNGEG
ncbi:MAG: helix-hairpin-helix domain-containing protein [Leptospirillia bacterium]